MLTALGVKQQAAARAAAAAAATAPVPAVEPDGTVVNVTPTTDIFGYVSPPDTAFDHYTVTVTYLSECTVAARRMVTSSAVLAGMGLIGAAGGVLILRPGRS